MKERAYEEMECAGETERTRAYIKIEDGCNNFCSYCIIPYARGPVRSRRPENVLAEAARIVAAGVGAICYSRTEPTGEVIGCAESISSGR